MVEPLSLYFHIPFCHKKCPYCHFYVIPDNANQRKALFAGLVLEWKRLLPKIQDHQVVSIYFGGGTPTLFGADFIAKLLEMIAKEATLTSDCEITIEGNPEDITLALMESYRNAGINRASIGIQSLEEDSLQVLGRTHGASQANEAVHVTWDSGIRNISIDLMFELPDQTPESFAKTLAKLPSLPISHLSLYNLTIEPNTPYFHQTLNTPSPEANLKMLTMAIEAIETMGLNRYEISAFAKPGSHSRHNTGYWTGRPFFGLGPSAFSFYGGARFRNVANLNRYLRALQNNETPVDFTETLPYPQNIHERLAVHLRLTAGVDLTKYALPDGTKRVLSRLEKEGYLQSQNTTCSLTEKGRLFYDTVATEII